MKCKDTAEGMRVRDQPLAMNGKLYMSGDDSNKTETVLGYSPNQDQWDELPPPPVNYFTVATLRGQLLVVGGIDRRMSAQRRTNVILTFDESSQRWLQSLPPLPMAVSYPTVVEYQDHLIVAGGGDSFNIKTTDVNILDTTTNKWTTAQPFPNADDYNPCLIGDTLYLVGRDTKQVFRADVPSLISQASSGVWETVASVHYYRSSPVIVHNTLLSVGGSNKGNQTVEIHMYNPINDQWIKCGELPEPKNCRCAGHNNKLYVFEPSWLSSSVYVSTLFITHDSKLSMQTQTFV